MNYLNSKVHLLNVLKHFSFYEIHRRFSLRLFEAFGQEKSFARFLFKFRFVSKPGWITVVRDESVSGVGGRGGGEGGGGLTLVVYSFKPGVRTHPVHNEDFADVEPLL